MEAVSEEKVFTVKCTVGVVSAARAGTSADDRPLFILSAPTVCMKLIMFGPPGSGKGTHGDLLSKTLHIPKLSTGDLVRAEIASGSALGKKIKPIYDTGGLVGDAIIIELLQKTFSASYQGFILDGFPRTMAQAEALEGLTAIDAVIALDVADTEVLRRLGGRWTCRGCAKVYGTDLKPKVKGVCDACGGALYQREDDTEETIKKRLAVYKKETEPLLRFYGQKGILKTISIAPNSSVEENFKKIVRAAAEVNR